MAELSKIEVLSELIKGEWDAISQYTGAMNQFEDLRDLLEEIVSEEYIHVGQLEEYLQSIYDVADNIEDGHNHEEHD